FRHILCTCFFFFISSRRRHTMFSRDWSSDVCSSDLVQQFSGQGPVQGHVAFKEYERYNVNDSDINNQLVTLFGTALSDISVLIKQATEEGSPHYAGVAKLLKAYIYQVDRKSTRLNSSH